jgi:lipopolysaccharide export system protein LptA
MFKNRTYIKFFFVGCWSFIIQNTSTAQVNSSSKQIEIKQAGSLSFDKEKNDAKVLSGNVICAHEGALLYCDTAYIYSETNRMVARGNVLITKGDSIRVTGTNLVYDGKTRIATLERNVKVVERDMTLTTNLLTFNLLTSIANYYNGGTLVNKQNTLISKHGHYYSSSKEATFQQDVVLTNPQYTMKCDTLRYKLPNKTAYFIGPTIITSKSDYIYCENGWYDTNKEKSAFSKNALLVTSQQKLKGDSLVYDRTLKFGKAFGNVTMIDTAQRSIVFGDYIEYKEFKSEAFVTKRALYARILDKDTLFLAADTLYHVDLDSVNNFLNAFHRVKIYKQDIQAVCDSASMNTKDSLLQLFKNPLLWSDRSQVSGKLIQVDVTKNQVRGFRIDGKAMMIQQLDSLHLNMFNQLAGKKLEGLVSSDTLRRIIVRGDAEILYYPKNKNSPTGLDQTSCKEIFMWFKHGEVERVTLKPKSVGKIDPLKTVDIENAKLKGFNWQYDKRPKSRFEIRAKK